MDYNKINDTIESATKWLLPQQHEDGGWAEKDGGHSNILNTAEVLIALMEGGTIHEEKINPGDKRILKAVNFLLQHQALDGSWPRVVTTDTGNQQEIPDLVRTSFVIRALIKSGVGVDTPAIKKSFACLEKWRDKKGGWGYKENEGPSLIPTCFVLLAFMEAYKSSDKDNSFEKPIEEGLRLLITWQNENEGYFGKEEHLKAIYTINAVLVFQAGRRCEISPYINQEQNAIDWLLAHRDQAMMLAEVKIEIDTDHRHNYDYLFMTDSLFLTVLMGSIDSGTRGKAVIIDALLNIKRKRDMNGGFYGYRVFSWSTAKVISALNSASKDYKVFPESTPIVKPTKGLKAGHVIFILILVFSATSFILMLKGIFTAMYAFFCLALALVALVAYRLISEKTFSQLFGNLVQSMGGKKSENEKKNNE